MFDGDTIEEVFAAIRSAVVAYQFSEQTFNDYCREYASILALTDGN